jgi:3-deoxy-D-manno-octulosonate 8-phosphate phosphatase (KDO 8-P phosphatase)
MPLIYDLMTRVKAFVFDVDGVLTDGAVLVTESGEQLRRMNIKDGYAISKALEKGFHLFVISGGQSEGVRKRLEYLGVKEIYLGVKNKVEIYNQLLKKYQLNSEQILYMGDDMPDLELIKISGVGCCPSNACVEVLQAVSYVSPFKGGEACARDVIEKTLKVQDLW